MGGLGQHMVFLGEDVQILAHLRGNTGYHTTFTTDILLHCARPDLDFGV